MKTLFFVTTNQNKLAVALAYLKDAGLLDRYRLEQLSIETPEMQHDSVEAIALESARWAATTNEKAVICADAGLAITALQGFPGPYVKYFNQTFTVEQVLRLMQPESDRSALWSDALAFYDPETGKSVVFRSDTKGMIAETPSIIASASTVDRLFIPEGFDKPLADLNDEQRASAWNTSRWQQLLEFLSK